MARNSKHCYKKIFFKGKKEKQDNQQPLIVHTYRFILFSNP